MKRILSILIMVIFMILAIALDSGIVGLVAFWNFPSLILILVIVFPMLIFSNNMPDYIRAYDIAITNHDYTTKELECSYTALGLAIRLTYLAAVFGFFTGLIGILSHIDDPSAFGPALAIALLTVYYAAIMNIFQYAIQAKVKKELIYRK